MKQFPIMITEEQHKRLRKHAFELSQDGVETFSMAEICRNAIAKELIFLDNLAKSDRKRKVENETI